MTGRAEPTGGMRRFIFVAMSNVRDAFKAEQLFKDAQLDAKVVPLPRHRRGLCGVALRFSPADERAAMAILGDGGIEIAARDEIDDYP